MGTRFGWTGAAPFFWLRSISAICAVAEVNHVLALVTLGSSVAVGYVFALLWLTGYGRAARRSTYWRSGALD